MPPNVHQLEYKRRELQAMMDARARLPPSPAQQHAQHERRRQEMFDTVLTYMNAMLDGLDILADGRPLPQQEARDWVDTLIEWAPLIAQVPFGSGPVKAPVQMAVKGFNKLAIRGYTAPKLEKAVNNGVALSGLAPVFTTPEGWAEKISAAASVMGYTAHGAAQTGAHLALPLGVKTALAPSLGNLLVQISHWTSATATTFGHVATCIAAVGPAMSAGMAAMNVALSYSKFDAVQAIAEHYGHYQCTCLQHVQKIASMSTDANMDRALALHPVFAPGVAAKAIDSKAHWAANKMRGPEQRTHRGGYAIATGLWEGAQAPSMHKAYKTNQLLVSSGRCPVALLAIATLLGSNADPMKGWQDAVAAIKADRGEGPPKIKGKIA
ncbi:hypothetical protein BOSP111201_23515 [Bordetella sputigena]|uniref:hypothetical protein n=1 Tax=Bordetella sputigena TaxID=1416810 RepID=UPI0039EFCE04